MKSAYQASATGVSLLSELTLSFGLMDGCRVVIDGSSRDLVVNFCALSVAEMVVNGRNVVASVVVRGADVIGIRLTVDLWPPFGLIIGRNDSAFAVNHNPVDASYK